MIERLDTTLDMHYRILNSNTRGRGIYRWLEATYLYSFANFYNPERIGFRNLLVINHDIISPNSGFGMHSHENMEIITIPLRGAISHQDNTGGQGRVPVGSIQYMSAGTTITHSETNDEDVECKLLQIWIQPKIQATIPYYQDTNIKWDQAPNLFNLIVDKNNNLEAKLYMMVLENNQSITKKFEYKNQAIYSIEGHLDIVIEGQEIRLSPGDLIEIQDNLEITIKENHHNSKLLLIELV
jgi:quercetin 2,3-dioxygenase